MMLGEKLDVFFAKYRFEYFGIVGCAVVAICTLVTALGFTGWHGEPYSLVNHYISELGSIESQWAWVFNVGLIAGVPFIFVFMLGTRAALQSRLAGIGRVIGSVASIGGFFVGIFPGNLATLPEHLAVAIMFFVGGGLAVLLLSVEILRQDKSTSARCISSFGLVVAGIFITFLGVAAANGGTDLEGNIITFVANARPAFYLSAFLEWLILIGILGWVFLVSATFLHRNPRARAASSINN
jgi:hypothetical membrane protein